MTIPCGASHRRLVRKLTAMQWFVAYVGAVSTVTLALTSCITIRD